MGRMVYLAAKDSHSVRRVRRPGVGKQPVRVSQRPSALLIQRQSPLTTLGDSVTTRKPAEFKDWPDDFQPAWEYKVVISDGGDGDNRYGMVDLGLLKYSFESFRLIAVDAPEVYSGPAMVRGWGKKTAAALAEICPPGTRVIAVTQKDKT